jgi:hypothetical protein
VDPKPLPFNPPKPAVVAMHPADSYTCARFGTGCNMVASSASSSDSGGSGWGSFIRKAVSVAGNVTGVTDAINCIKNPSLGTCVKAAIKLTATAATVATLGGSATVEAAAEGTAELTADTTADAGVDVSAEAGGDDATAAEEGGWKPSGRPAREIENSSLSRSQKIMLGCASLVAACSVLGQPAMATGALAGASPETSVTMEILENGPEVDMETAEGVERVAEGSEEVVPEQGDSGGLWKLPGSPGW